MDDPETQQKPRQYIYKGQQKSEAMCTNAEYYVNEQIHIPVHNRICNQAVGI